MIRNALNLTESVSGIQKKADYAFNGRVDVS